MGMTTNKKAEVQWLVFPLEDTVNGCLQAAHIDCSPWRDLPCTWQVLDAMKHYGWVVLIVSSLLNIAYLLPPVWKAFYVPDGIKTDFDGDGIKEAPWACVLPLSITALGCFALFVWPDGLIVLAKLMTGGPS